VEEKGHGCDFDSITSVGYSVCWVQRKNWQLRCCTFCMGIEGTWYPSPGENKEKRDLGEY
jgi:hypothetical protein